MPISRRLLAPLAAALALAGMAAGPAAASHSWAGYHWARAANPFTLKLGDNVSTTWDPYLATTSSDWTSSTVLDTTIVLGSVSNLRRCPPTTGRVQVCNTTYGNNGWLGLASVWASGSHITQGTVKLNDTYFNTSSYNTLAWRNHVMCQEVGHTLGLDHQSTTGESLGTCMDYASDPSASQHPNTHDYDELGIIYAHTNDNTTTVDTSATSPSAAGAGNSQAEWGKAVRFSAGGRPILFERDLGNDQRVFTFVIWTR